MIYKHDCSACVFICSIGSCDVYICERTLVIRYGNAGKEYLSLPLEKGDKLDDIPGIAKDWIERLGR